MANRISAVLGIVASLALGLAMMRLVASAQDGNSAALSVSSRVYDKKQLLTPTGFSDDVQRGRTLWVQRCAFCHDGVGQPTYKTMGRWLDAGIVQSLGEEKVRTAIAAGNTRMPGFRYALQPQQMDDLIAFLKTVTPDQKPTPEQMNGAQGTEGGE